MTLFQTERLIVRTYAEADYEDFYLFSNSEEVMRYIRPVKNREEARIHFDEVMEYSKANPLYGRWAAIEKTTGNFAGSFAVIPVEGTAHMQLGYALMPPFWSKGYATELTVAGIEYVFTKTDLQHIYAYTELPNTASQKVLAKCGFKQVEIKKVGEKDLVEFILVKETYTALFS